MLKVHSKHRDGQAFEPTLRRYCRVCNGIGSVAIDYSHPVALLNLLCSGKIVDQPHGRKATPEGGQAG
jgi:hypothetical protein